MVHLPNTKSLSDYLAVTSKHKTSLLFCNIMVTSSEQFLAHVLGTGHQSSQTIATLTWPIFTSHLPLFSLHITYSSHCLSYVLLIPTSKLKVIFIISLTKKKKNVINGVQVRQNRVQILPPL